MFMSQGDKTSRSKGVTFQLSHQSSLSSISSASSSLSSIRRASKSSSFLGTGLALQWQGGAGKHGQGGAGIQGKGGAGMQGQGGAGSKGKFFQARAAFTPKVEMKKQEI